MSRLIDADALKKRLADVYENKTTATIIDEQPTIDGVPVVHGTWDDTRVAFYRACSECSAIVRNNLGEVFLFSDGKLNYCPNCGAKMDGGDVDNGTAP